jgi:hypothetical protein
MADNTPAWLKRAKEILKEATPEMGPSEQAIPFAISMYTAIYGPQSTQLMALKDEQQLSANSAITNIIAEIEGGLIADTRAQIAGEVLSELVGLGKEILSDGGESAKNVSAVLIAAAFEDLIRRMGSELAGVTGRPKLEDVLIALKNAGVLKAGLAWQHLHSLVCLYSLEFP